METSYSACDIEKAMVPPNEACGKKMRGLSEKFHLCTKRAVDSCSKVIACSTMPMHMPIQMSMHMSIHEDLHRLHT